MADQTRYPTGDGPTGGTISVFPVSPTTRYDKCDDGASPDDYTTYMTGEGNNCHQCFTFPAFTLPSTAIVANIEIFYRCAKQASQTARATSCLHVNGTLYNDIDPGIDPPNGSFQTYSYVYTTNPDTAAAWLYDDINGSGSNPLTAFGVTVPDANPDVDVTAVWAVVTYTSPIIELLAGQSDGVAIVSNIPALKSIRKFDGTSDGGSVVANIPAMKASRKFDGTADGIAVVSDIPAIKVAYDLALNPSVGGSTAEADVTVTSGVEELLAGLSDGLSTAAATVDVTKKFIGASDGIGATANIPELKKAFNLSGDITAGLSTAAIVGMKSTKAFDGITDGLSTALVTNCKVSKKLLGISDGAAVVSNIPALQAVRELIGASAGLSTAVIPAMTAIREVLGSAAGAATVTNIPVLKKAFNLTLDQITGLSTASALTKITKKFIGATDGLSTAIATATKAGEQLLAGISDGASTADATLTGIWRLIGTSAGNSTADVATIKCSLELAGQTDGLSTAVVAKINCLRKIAGTSDGLSTVTGLAKITKKLAGGSDGLSTALANVTVTTAGQVETLSGISAGSSTATATFWVNIHQLGYISVSRPKAKGRMVVIRPK